MEVTRPEVNRDDSSLDMLGISLGARELVRIILLLSLARASNVYPNSICVFCLPPKKGISSSKRTSQPLRYLSLKASMRLFLREEIISLVKSSAVM